MGSKKSRKQKRSPKASKPRRRKILPVLMVLICTAIAGAGGWLLYNESGVRTDPKPEASNAQTSSREAAQTISADNFQNLHG